MMFYIPLLGATLDAGGTVLYKFLANRQRVTYKDFMVYGFGAIVLVSLPLLYFFWDIHPLAGRNMNMALLAMVVVFSIFANYFTFFAFKNKDLSKIQTLRLTLPLFTVIIAFLLSFVFEVYADERNYFVLPFALIASVTLIISNMRKHHFKFDKYSWAMLIGSFFFALELTLSKPLVPFYHPVTLYFIRSFFIFIVAFALFRGQLSKVKRSGKWLFIAAALFWVGYRALLYYAYGVFGIVFTTTVFILSPVLIYLSSWMFLKEKITVRQVISSMVIVACVIGAIWVGN